MARIGTPAVIKTAAYGYDGKGQHKITTPAGVEHVWTAIGHQEAVVEKFIEAEVQKGYEKIRPFLQRYLDEHAKQNVASSTTTSTTA